MAEIYYPKGFNDYEEYFGIWDEEKGYLDKNGNEIELPDYFCFTDEHWTDEFWEPIMKKCIEENKPWTDFVQNDHESTYNPNVEY